MEDRIDNSCLHSRKHCTRKWVILKSVPNLFLSWICSSCYIRESCWVQYCLYRYVQTSSVYTYCILAARRWVKYCIFRALKKYYKGCGVHYCILQNKSWTRTNMERINWVPYTGELVFNYTGRIQGRSENNTWIRYADWHYQHLNQC